MKQISFLINTSVNTLDHVKLLLKSLKENLAGKEHEILIFVDSDNEGTVDYLREQKKDFFDLKIITHKLNPCVGYSRNNNLLVELAKHDIVSYLQSDMVISPNYDLEVLSDLEENCILSATRIEPPLHGESYQTITKDFGTDPNEFKWDEFQSYSITVKENRTIGYFFAPFTFYKKVWMDLGGYDTLFRRSREDSDLLQRFIQAGVKIKQTFRANVYHFSCVSSRGKNWFDPNSQEAQNKVKLQNFADEIELKRFIRKWGRFNHGEEKLAKLDTDLVIVNNSSERLSIIAALEPYFTRVWLKSEEEKEHILAFYKAEHSTANQLLKFSHPDWEEAKKFYNQTDYNAIYQVGEPQDFNIKVTVKIEDGEQRGFLFMDSNRFFLTEMISPLEPGTYGLENTTVEVRKVVNRAENQLVVENPPFDYSLLTIE
jgi:GT2 family glycosyltransferase